MTPSRVRRGRLTKCSVVAPRLRPASSRRVLFSVVNQVVMMCRQGPAV